MVQMNATQQAQPSLQAGSHTPTLAVFLIWIANVITLWSHRARSRQHLVEMDDYLLRDLGITRAEAEEESLKRFWMP